MAQSQSKNSFLSKKNPMAKWLRQRRYRMLVIKNKKKYNRKNNEIIQEL